MYFFLKAVTYILFLSVFLFFSEASEQNQKISEETMEHIRSVYQYATKERFNDEELAQLWPSCIEVFSELGSWQHQAQEPPQILLKGAATAFGLLSFCSPYTLQLVEAFLIPYLQSKQLSYRDLRKPLYPFRFGEVHSRASTNSNIAQMVHGQLLDCHFHLNLPVYFNKLLGEFKGDYLLIGGGTNCECEDATNRHPEEIFYSIDIDNAHLPNVVIHAGYMNHLATFPEERFSFIWFEHCTIAELFTNEKVLDQYFRFSKPGCIFLFQSSFSLENQENLLENSYKKFIKTLEKYHFSVLEYKKSLAFRKHVGGTIPKEMEFRQLIALKPFKINTNEGPSKRENPINIKINIDLYRKPNSEEEGAALLKAKVLSRQLKFTPLSWETIDSWLTPKTEDHAG